MEGKLSPEHFIDFMAKEARKNIETDFTVLHAEKVEAWKEVENWILTYKKGNY